MLKKKKYDCNIKFGCMEDFWTIIYQVFEKKGIYFEKRFVYVQNYIKIQYYNSKKVENSRIIVYTSTKRELYKIYEKSPREIGTVNK